MADVTKPNLLVLWGDDIGWYNLSHHNQGAMGYRTPNIDRIAEEGLDFTDYYGQQSCTAGRAAFITGQNPLRTGLTKVGTVALDGTKVKANASPHKAMSYDRMKEEEQRLKDEVARMLTEAQSADEAEEATHGPDRRGDELPDELRFREQRLAKIREAKGRLEDQARAEAEAQRQRRAESAAQVERGDPVLPSIGSD